MRTPEQIEEILDKVEKLLSDFDAANDRFDRGEWGKKFGERLGGYSDKLKRLNGKDFDIMNASYDEYHNDYKDMTDDQYVDILEENIKKVIEQVWPEAPAEEIAEHVAEDVEKHSEEEEPAVSMEIEEKSTEDDDDVTSDARAKRVAKMKDAWKGSPHTSGGRDGTTSDEEAKEEPKEDEEEAFRKELEDYKANHKD